MSGFYFDKYACVGDISTVEKDGFLITATLDHDGDTRPDDFDCYDEVCHSGIFQKVSQLAWQKKLQGRILE